MRVRNVRSDSWAIRECVWRLPDDTGTQCDGSRHAPSLLSVLPRSARGTYSGSELVAAAQVLHLLQLGLVFFHEADVCGVHACLTCDLARIRTLIDRVLG